MHLVQQLTPFTCGLACIESVSFDLGHPITQAELLVRYKDELIGSAGEKIEQFGAQPETTSNTFLTILAFPRPLTRTSDLTLSERH